jgi:hypothetical protein
MRKRHWIDRVDKASVRVVGREWCTTERWEPAKVDVGAAGTRSDRPMLILADEGGFGDALARRQQRPVRVVRRADAVDETALRAILDELHPADAVSFWSIDADDHAPVAGAGPAVQAALTLLQAAAREPLRLTIVTRGVVSVAGEAPRLAQAPWLSAFRRFSAR